MRLMWGNERRIVPRWKGREIMRLQVAIDSAKGSQATSLRLPSVMISGWTENYGKGKLFLVNF